MILVRDLYLLVRDDQENIRILGNASCVALARVLSEEDRGSLILPLFLGLAEDGSWRVRYTTVTQIGDICALFSRELVESKLLPAFLKLLQDNELEVRTIAASSVSTICRFLRVEKVEEMISVMTILSSDTSEHVRVGLASDFLSTPLLAGVSQRRVRDGGVRNHGEAASAGVFASADRLEHESASHRGGELRQNQVGTT